MFIKTNHPPTHTHKMYMATGSYLSIITLTVNGLNAPTQRQRLVNWVKKNKTPIYAVYKRLTSNLGTHAD